MKLNKNTTIIKFKFVPSTNHLENMNEFIIKHGKRYYKYIIPNVDMEWFKNKIDDGFNNSFIPYKRLNKYKKELVKELYEDLELSDTYYSYTDMVRIGEIDNSKWIGGVRELLSEDDLCYELMK